MKPTIVTPATPIIDLARAKLHCKLTGAARDTEVTEAILAAQGWVQEELGVAIGPQRLSFVFARWSGCATLPYEITAVVSVTGASGPLAFTKVGRTISAMGEAPVEIVVDCGLPGASVPAQIKWAMLLVINDLMENQYAQTEVQLHANKAAENLIWPFRERHPI